MGHWSCSCAFPSIIAESPIEYLEGMALTSEALPPKGVIEWRFEDLRAEQFFFNERFMHIVLP